MKAEPIALVLKTCGVLFTFPSTEVLGIPCFSVTTFLKEQDSTYSSDVINYSFQVATADVIDETIEVGTIFSFESDFHLLTFATSTPLYPDNGWSSFKADLVSREPL